MIENDDIRTEFLEIWADYSDEKPEVTVERRIRRRDSSVRGGMIRPGVEGNIVAAESLIAKGRMDEALRRLERVLNEDPDHREALFKTALIRKQLGMNSDALKAFDRLIELEPDFAGLRYERGTCRFQTKDWKGAMEDLETYVHMARGRPEEERFVNKALRLHADAEKRITR